MFVRWKKFVVDQISVNFVKKKDLKFHFFQKIQFPKLNYSFNQNLEIITSPFNNNINLLWQCVKKLWIIKE